MQWFLYFTGAVWIAAGAWFVLYTKESRDFTEKFLRTVNGMFVSFLALVFGILLIVSSFYSREPVFVFVLGILGAAKGCLFLANPRNIYFKARDWLLEKASDQTIRLFGIISLILGTAVLSWI